MTLREYVEAWRAANPAAVVEWQVYLAATDIARGLPPLVALIFHGDALPKNQSAIAFGVFGGEAIGRPSSEETSRVNLVRAYESRWMS